MSLAAAILSAAVSATPLMLLALADPAPVGCRPAPYYVADRSQGRPTVTALAAPQHTVQRGAADKAPPCYLTRSGGALLALAAWRPDVNLRADEPPNRR